MSIGIDSDAREHGGVTLVTAVVRNDDDADRRVRVTNELDGVVRPPARDGVAVEGWDADGFEGVVPGGGGRSRSDTRAGALPLTGRVASRGRIVPGRAGGGRRRSPTRYATSAIPARPQRADRTGRRRRSRSHRRWRRGSATWRVE
ncbi:DUF7857 domain-containing protein [Halarchaeum nitratireducens]|uniref:Uncharacterized protein n=1 Tax=Halarchaeum nitratireducens TaxID=489913 RepID=A0A830GA78_9EURY|nr:hypothetical protein [Halarchaeum nitratireducens]GGN12371.1 hypothetical protein GCM10009021_10440 [Halarchaeum nitratireducens]